MPSMSCLTALGAVSHTIYLIYQSWCAPCRQLSPILEKWTNDPHKTEDGLPFDMVKINVDTDDGQYLSQKYKVRMKTISCVR